MRESVSLTSGSVTLQTFYMHKVIYNTICDRENPKKHNRSPLKENEMKINEWITFLVIFQCIVSLSLT